MTNIELFLPIPPVMKKTRGVNEACSTFKIRELWSLFLSCSVFFVASFEGFVFMTLSIWIENFYIKKMVSAKITKVLLHWYDLLLISAWSSIDTLAPTDFLPTFVISVLFLQNLWLHITFRRYFLIIRCALESQNLCFTW